MRKLWVIGFVSALLGLNACTESHMLGPQETSAPTAALEGQEGASDNGVRRPSLSGEIASSDQAARPLRSGQESGSDN